MLTLAASLLLLAQEDVDLFEKRIRPVLHASCIPCHGPDKVKAGLRVDSRTASSGAIFSPCWLPHRAISSTTRPTFTSLIAAR